MSKKFSNPYDAGYDAGLNGANSENCSFRWFNKPENTKEWERGNDDGKAQLKSEQQPKKKRILQTYKKK